MELLVCTKCKKEKPGNSAYFPLHNKKRNGLDSWCRDCRATYRSSINRGKFRSVISDNDLKELKASIDQCVICGSNEKLVIDHDHKTNKIRGLLCNHCNRGLGHFRDDPMLLEFAAMYIYASVDSPKWEEYLKTKAWNC